MVYYIAGAAAVVIIVLIYLGDNIFSRTRYTVFSQKLSEGKRLLLISDIHSKRVEKQLGRITDSCRPDIIVIAGDLWDRHKGRRSEMMDLAEALCEKAEVVYSPGNHDYSFPDRERMLKELSERGVHVLRADRVRIRGIDIYGLDYYGCRIFADSLLGEAGGGFNVLVTHFPQYFEEYTCYGIDLILCGHAHGGQFRIPIINKGLYSPGQGIFPKYSEGMHEKRGTKLIVTRGIGNSNRFPFRLFNPPEAVMIDIRPETERGAK